MITSTSTLAIDGGSPVRTQPWPEWPRFDEREERALLEVLHSRRWGTLSGDKVTTFEQRFAQFQGARYGVCVPNGALALQMALQALGIGPGDEVITSPYTFIATASAALAQGARPVARLAEPAPVAGGGRVGGGGGGERRDRVLRERPAEQHPPALVVGEPGRQRLHGLEPRRMRAARH